MCFYQCPHQPHTSRDSGDPREAVTRNLSPLSTRPWGIQAHEGGISAHTERAVGGWIWEGLDSEFQMLQLLRIVQDPGSRQEGCSLAPGDTWVMLLSLALTHIVLSPCRGLCLAFIEHIKWLEGDYPGVALPAFCWLSRKKELSFLISYWKPKSKLNGNKTLIKSYSSAF